MALQCIAGDLPAFLHFYNTANEILLLDITLLTHGQTYLDISHTMNEQVKILVDR